MSDTYFSEAREEMAGIIAAYAEMSADRVGRPAFSERVMAAMRKVPRHEFVPAELRHLAYIDSPLPIGYEKTISQPFIVALMTDMLDIGPQDCVLEVGTGLGYQAAVLAELAHKVYSIDIIEELLEQAKTRLARQRYRNIEFKLGNGCYGWPEHAPFDKIIVTAAPDLIPGALLQQLKPGGRMAIPTGLAEAQQLVLVEKDGKGAVTTRELLPVRFSQLEGAESQFQRGS
jgi:protein-L-isoaspartate(D-aspartate) O-methyltransferase